MLLESGIAAALGTLAGIVEKPLTKYMETQAKKLEYDHIEKMQNLNHEHEVLMAENELISDGIKADAAIMSASYEHDMNIGETSVWVNNIRALVRPAAVLGTGVMAYMDAQYLPAFTLCLTWYFASRARATTPE